MNSHIAAPTSYQVGDKTYILNPLTMQDFRELEKFLQQQVVESVKPTLAGLDSQLALGLLKQAHLEGLKIRIGSEEFNQAAMSIEGLTYLTWLSIRRKQPEFTPQTAAQLMDLTEWSGMLKKVLEMAGWSDATENPIPPVAQMSHGI